MTRPEGQEPSSSPAQAGRSRRPAGLAGMLVLVAAVELAIGGRHLAYTSLAVDDWRQTAAAARTRAPGRDVLCFGDSLVKYGVLPRVIERQAGLSCYNLALNAGPMPAEYFLLRRALAAGARPRAIVADFFALMLADRPMWSTRAYPELATWGECLDLAWTAGDGDFLASTWLGKVVPSVRCRFELRAAIATFWDERSVAPAPGNRLIRALWDRQLGAQPMPAAPGQDTANPGLVADLTPATWACDPINAAYFERFVALAEAHRIPIFWIMPPLGPEIRAGRLARGTDAAYARFARAALRRHPSLVVLDARGAGYDASAHVDPIHLNDRGAAILSGDVAAALGDHLGGRPGPDRWRDLPPVAGRSATDLPDAAVAGRGAAGATR